MFYEWHTLLNLVAYRASHRNAVVEVGKGWRRFQGSSTGAHIRAPNRPTEPKWNSGEVF